jgi:hypothetical protein
MPDLSRIIDRVRKMLAVSKSDNEHEAALAAQRAASIMEEYHLTEAQLRVEDASRAAEPITAGAIPEPTKKRVAWKEFVAQGVAKSLGCHVYLAEGNILTAVGREGAVQAWVYTTQYLYNEVDRLADEAWLREGLNAQGAGQSIRKWKNSFRVGAGQSIMMRLYEDKAPPPANTTEQALMIIEKDDLEVQNAYVKITDRMGTAGAIGYASNRTGYKAGREAGNNMHLGGGRAALNEGQRHIKGTRNPNG